MTFKVGNVVRDRFKRPKPGEPDDVCIGEVVEVGDGNVTVEMRLSSLYEGSTRTLTEEQARHLFEIVE